MRILFTNHTLGDRSGTEVYIRDVALALLARGHQPIAYSRHLGEVARELRSATVPVIDDLEQLREPPDLIHAQHHLEAVTALARFPETPAIYLCHGWLPDEEAPPRHPGILIYGAVDQLVRQRLTDECGIDDDDIRLLLNFVDLERFRAREPLPQRPKRALVFSNYMSDDHGLAAVRAACESEGVRLEVIGRAQGTTTDRPESRLADYDVVFAKGRSALEAAAVGATVVLCDAAGLGPRVETRRLDELRAYNFGVRLLRDPITIGGVRERLSAYDATDAVEVCRRIREQAGLDAAVDRLLEIYRQVLERHRADPLDPKAGARAISHYLRHGPLSGGSFHRPERERLLAELAAERAQVAELRRIGEEVSRHRIQLERKLASALEEKHHLDAQLATIEADCRRLQSSQQELLEAKGRFLQEQDQQRVAQRELEEKIRELETTRLGLEEKVRELDRQNLERRTELDRLRLELEKRHQVHEAQRQELERLRLTTSGQETELDWIRGSATWRLRRALLRLIGRGP